MHAAYLDLFNRFRNYVCGHGRPHIGANGGQLTPHRKMDEKVTSENMQKEQFSMLMLYFESNQGRQV